jgi:hypothetical protein
VLNLDPNGPIWPLFAIPAGLLGGLWLIEVVGNWL